jgi:hypothetical protein
MASVRLGRYEAEDYDLPRVCMRCGARAVTYKQRRFRWFPGWLIVIFPFGILPYIILTEVMTKRMAVWVPYCERHQKRPLWPLLVYAGILAALVALTIGLMVILQGRAAGFICLGGFLAFLVWCMAAAIIGTPGIRPTEITDKSITLKGVCEEFIAALEADRRGELKSDGRDKRARRKRPRDDESDGSSATSPPAGDEDGYYDPGRAQRRPPGDAYEEGGDRH